MNILEVEDIIKGLPDQALQKEAQAPSGQVPQFLVVSEIQRRTDMRKRFQSQQQEQPQGTISQQIVQEGIASIAPPPQQMMPQQPMPSQQMPMQQMPQGNPQSQLPAQPMYRGGVVEMNQGRQATIGPFEEEEEEELYPGVLMGGRNPMSIRQFNQDFLGETGTYTTPSGGEFVEYESPEYSFRAADRVLTTYGRDQGINTIRDAISRYAPPSDDNPTENYIDFVSKQTGIDPDQKIDLSDPIIRSNIIAPMAQFESRTTISPSGVRDSIASVDQDYAATLPERRMNALSPEVQSGVQVPTEGFPVPSVQTEDPRLSIPFVEVGPEGGRRENEFAGTESTEALLDAITKGKPFRKGQGKERQGTVARLPGEVTKAISNAIKSDADRTSGTDVASSDAIEAVGAFTSKGTSVPEVISKEERKTDIAGLIDLMQSKNFDVGAADLSPAATKDAYLDTGEQDPAKRSRILEILGAKGYEGGPDTALNLLKERDKERRAARTTLFGSPEEREKMNVEFDRSSQFLDLMKKYFKPDVNIQQEEKRSQEKTGLKEAQRPPTGLKETPLEEVSPDKSKTTTTTTTPTTTAPTTTPEETPTPPPETRSGDQGVAAMMSDYGRTRDEAKREAFANAMIQLGAGVAKGDLSAGLSAAGKAASETMKDFRKERQDERRLDIMKDRYDQYAASTNPANQLLLRVQSAMNSKFDKSSAWRVEARELGMSESEYKEYYRNNLIKQYAPVFNLDPADIVGQDIEADPFDGPIVRDGQIDRKPTTVTSVQRVSE